MTALKQRIVDEQTKGFAFEQQVTRLTRELADAKKMADWALADKANSGKQCGIVEQLRQVLFEDRQARMNQR
jgi:hypothetical protein